MQLDNKRLLEKIEFIVKNPINIFALALLMAITAVIQVLWIAIIGLMVEVLYIGVRLVLQNKPIGAGNTLQIVEATEERCLIIEPSHSKDEKIIEDAKSNSGHIAIPVIKDGTVYTDSKERQYYNNETNNVSYRSDLPITGGSDINISSLDPIYKDIMARLTDNFPVKQEFVTHIDSLYHQYRNLFEIKEKMQKHLINLLDDALSADNIFTSPIIDINLGMPSIIYKSLVDQVQIDGSERYDEWVKKIVTQIHNGYENRLRELALARNDAFDNIDVNSLTKAILKRNRLSDKIGSMLFNIYFELQLICTRLSQISKEIHVRKTDHILNDMKALSLQLRSLLRTIDDLELKIANINQDRDTQQFENV